MGYGEGRSVRRPSRGSRDGGGYSRGRTGNYKRNARREDDYGDSVIMFEVDSDNSKAPVYRLIIKIDGREYEAGLWEKDGKKGPFWAGQVNPKQDERRERYERDRDKDRDRDGGERGRRDRDRDDEYRSRDCDPDDDGRERFRDDPGPSGGDDYGARA
ncbi:MAG: hypothetical protein ACLP7P_08465 [Rhodomicrobium sp.]